MRIPAVGQNDEYDLSQAHIIFGGLRYLGGGSCIIPIDKQVWIVPSMSHGRQYFKVQHSILACYCQESSLYYRTLNVTIKWYDTKNKIQFTVIPIVSSYELPREKIWTMCKEYSLLPY